jgi:gliding motility-associated-like protein
VNLAVTKNANPATSSITGDNSVCADVTGESYSVTNTAGSTYAWTITGGTQASGTSTSSITVNWGASGAGSVQVIETNTAGCIGTAVNLAVTRNANPTTSAITGNNSACADVTGESYSVINTPGSTYDWTITGGTQASGTNTNSITVNWGAVGTGTLQLTERITVTGCETTTSVYNVTINSNPSPVISGANTVCAGETGLAYNATDVVGHTYSWSIAGGSIAEGAGTNNITVDWATVGTGTLQLTERITTTGCEMTTQPYNVSITNPSLAFTGCNSATLHRTADSDCSVIVTWDPPAIAALECVTITSTHNPGDAFARGVTRVTYTARDLIGNESTCSFDVIVEDETDPVFTCDQRAIVVDSEPNKCGAFVTWTPPTATDNCSVTVTSNYKPGDFFEVGTTTVTYRADDGYGNVVTCEFDVTVTDITPPLIMDCPGEQTATTTTGCGTNVTWTEPTASDNCPRLLTVESNYEPGDFFPVGTTTVTYSVNDGAGNTTACSFNVVVLDTTPPGISCPSDVVVIASGSCESIAHWEMPGATDNCELDTVFSTHASGEVFPLGTTEVISTAKDINGNTTICTFNVIVKSDEPPLFSNCPDNIHARALDADGVGVTWAEPTATALCSDVTLAASHRPGELFTIGSTEVIYTATDHSANQSECAFSVHVEYEEIDFGIERIITPDGDGINDTWTLNQIEKFKDNKVLIVDRWGGVIFSASGYNNENIVWNGLNSNGVLVPTGTYFYTIAVKLGPSVVEKRGFVELIR